MKFLLAAVNAKFIHSNPAIYSLRACAGERLQKHIELAEYTINMSLQEILADLYMRHPDAVGFSCYIWNRTMIENLLRELPKLLPDCALWLGGPEVSYDAEEILRVFPQVSGVMIGEGEVTFREVLEYYVEGGKRLQEIPGLYLPTGYTPMRTLTNLSDIPFLYQDLKPFENRIIYYETSRGCPFRCSYCLSSLDKAVRLRDIEIVKRELSFFLDAKVKQVKFVDRTFNCNHEHAMAVWQYLKEHDNGVTNFHFEISADILREDEIALLHSLRPGLVQLEIGVQTTNPETLRAIHRVSDVTRLEKIVAAVHAGHNIHQHLDLIAGLPYEDYDSFACSFDRVYAMRPQQLQLGFLKVLKGSEMESRAKEYGLQAMSCPPYEVLCTKWLPYEDVLKLKKTEEMVELYYNSGQFVHTLSVLVQAFTGAFAMFEALAQFFEENGYFTNHPARGYRYEILLAFAKKYDADRAALYRELLTYDLYLRENVKSRPEYAADRTAFQKAVREFYAQEEKERRYLPAYKQYDRKQLAGMTHLEAFRYPVWESGELSRDCRAGDKPFFVLFDYQTRNPLNYEASVQVVKLPETGEER